MSNIASDTKWIFEVRGGVNLPLGEEDLRKLFRVRANPGVARESPRWSVFGEGLYDAIVIQAAPPAN